MPKRNAKTTWVVVADGARARIITVAEGDVRMRELAAWESAEAKKPSRDLVSDRQGRTHESAGTGTRHAVEARIEPHRKAKQSFVRDLVRRIERATRQGAFDSLVLVAPPMVLGELRQSLSRPAAALVSREVKKDLTRTPLTALAKHLPGVLPPVNAARGR